MKTYIKILFLVIFSIVTSYCSAQNHLILHGNVGVENVNIQVVDTEYGTSSDNNYNYRLLLYNQLKDIKLLYSCVGYQDTVIELKSDVFELDSVEISFKMRKITYILQKASISANRDFYRSKNSNTIIDISFVDNHIIILENKRNKSELLVLDNQGDKMSSANYDSLYSEIFIDCFGDYILVGEHNCKQIYFNEKYKPLTVTDFSRKDFEDKLQNCICEFGNSYIFKDKTMKNNDFYVREDHNKSQTFFFMNKDDTLHEKHLLFKMFDKDEYKVAASYFSEILAMYYGSVADNENEIILGVWNGNIMRLLPQGCFPCLVKISEYIKLMALPLKIDVVKGKDFLFLVYFDKKRIISFDTDLNILSKEDLTITSGDKYFKNQFVTDEVTGKVYGVFVKDGISHIGQFDAESGSVGMTAQASNYIYPKVLKINEGYAYGVYFDVEKQRGFINRRRINNE